MDDLKLIIPIDSLRQSKSGAIYGQVYFQLGTETFPGPGWSDLAVAFVLAWIVAVMRLSSSKAGSERVRFMDGPYWVDLAKGRTDGDAVSVQMITDRLKGPVANQFVAANLGNLLYEAVELAQEVLAACREKGWNNSDIDELTERMKAVGSARL